MNKNTIITNDWSNPASGKLYQDQLPDEPELATFGSGESFGSIPDKEEEDD
jgi:hypothetical protein